MLPFMSNAPFSGEEAQLKDVIFVYLSKLMSYCCQLRFNHWQTTSFAEHKMTDGLMEDLTDQIDKLGEMTLGAFGRPQFQTVTYNICDNAVCGAKHVLDTMEKETKALIDLLSVTAFEDIKNTLADILALVNKNKYLSTLE